IPVKASLALMLPSATGRSVSASPCWCNRLVVDLSQRIHELQFALDLEKKMRLDCEEEVNRLISENGDLREQVAAVKTELLERREGWQCRMALLAFV
ncbi:unnamed protein product, partial [Nesidiocoris tenuis]